MATHSTIHTWLFRFATTPGSSLWKEWGGVGEFRIHCGLARNPCLEWWGQTRYRRYSTRPPLTHQDEAFYLSQHGRGCHVTANIFTTPSPDDIFWVRISQKGLYNDAIWSSVGLLGCWLLVARNQIGACGIFAKLNLGSSDYNKIDVKATEEKYDNGGNCRQDNNFHVVNMCGF